MIEESIKAVKAAEEKAEAMLADARKEADAIIVKAKADGESPDRRRGCPGGS